MRSSASCELLIEQTVASASNQELLPVLPSPTSLSVSPLDQQGMSTASTNQTLDSRKTEVSIANTLMSDHITLGPPAHELKYHLYYSAHNCNATHAIEKMRAELRDGASLCATCDPEQFDRAHQMLVFLDSETNFSDDNALLAELRRGVKNVCASWARSGDIFCTCA